MSDPAAVVLERALQPPGPYRFPYLGRDGLLKRRDDGIVRLLHHEQQPVTVAAWINSGGVRLRAEGPSRVAAAYGIDRMTFALGLEHDISQFQQRFAKDSLVGPVIRRKPWLRPKRVPEPFEALAWAITEQLIESVRAAEIQRRMIWRYGREHKPSGLHDSPTAAALAERSPAEFQSCDLSAARSLALLRASREVAASRIDLSQHEPAWQRLLKIREIGPWTVEKLAVHGQGRDDQLPAGDLAFVVLVGRRLRLGRRATVEEVHRFFAPYEEHRALAGLYAMSAVRA